MIRHTIPLETKFAADEAGVIAGYASLWGGEPDSYGDVVAPGAFTASLAEHRKRGTAPVMLWAHDQSRPIGAWTDVREDAIGLSVKGRIAIESNAGREAYALLQAKALSGLSIGYIEKAATPMPGGVRRLDAVDLVEISLVTLPAASGARITSVKSVADITPKWLTQVLRDAGVSRGMADGIIRHGWRGAIEESSEAESAQLKRILEILNTATAQRARGYK